MFKRVDDVSEGLQGFSYKNAEGQEEKVAFDDDDDQCVFIGDSTGDKICIYTQDIPNLIKALQATYNHLKG